MSEDGVPAGVRLLVESGQLEGTSHELSSEETLLGRNPSADVTLNDDGISREHALISFDAQAGTWTIEDLQSTNGTKVNGKRVRSATLTADDEIQLGRTRLRFSLPDAG